MRDCSGKMWFYCHLLVATIVIEAAVAANVTVSTSSIDVKRAVDTETKNKRQVNQFLRTPGASIAPSLGTEQEPQAFPLQLSHGIYSQQRLPLYTRRPTTISKPQVTEDDVEQEQQPQLHQQLQLQQQQKQSILPSYYNYVPEIDENDDDTVHIDSRHLPVEPRSKVENSFQSTPPQRLFSYSSAAPKQSISNQALVSEDEYFDLIRNTDLVKNSQAISSKSPYGYATATPNAAIENAYDSTKSPFNGNDYKKYTSRTNYPSSPSSPVPNLQPQTSQQQFVRQPAHFVTVGPTQDYSQSYDKDTIRVSLKKYHESAGKAKFDPANGQYHQEVSVKPTKKVVNFKPSYQYANTPQSSNQQPTVQQQPLQYQSVQQISQTESKSGQQQAIPQSQYSIVLPQTHQAQQAQQAYYSAETSHPFQSFLPQNERLFANNYAQTSPEQSHLQGSPQQSDNKPNEPTEFRIQYLQHLPPASTPTPTPTPTPRARYVSDRTPGQPLKYELYESNGNGNGNVNVNAPKEASKIKLITPPQHVHRPQYSEAPQYFKKIKIQPAAHVHYVPVRSQYHQQQTVQPPAPQASAAQGQSDLLIPIQPSRATLFVAPSTGQIESVSPSASINSDKLAHQISAGHQHTEPRKPPLPITSPKKPISQAEFQALIDAGYKVQAIPVPVPVPADKFKQLQYQPQQRHIQPVHNVAPHHPVQHTRQATTHYIRYHPKQESEEGILTSYLKPLIDYIGGPSQ